MSASKDQQRRTICELAIAKYGEPKLEVLETIEVEDNEITKLVDLLNEAEKKWIKEYNSTERKNAFGTGVVSKVCLGKEQHLIHI